MRRPIATMASDALYLKEAGTYALGVGCRVIHSPFIASLLSMCMPVFDAALMLHAATSSQVEQWREQRREAGGGIILRSGCVSMA